MPNNFVEYNCNKIKYFVWNIIVIKLDISLFDIMFEKFI